MLPEIIMDVRTHSDCVRTLSAEKDLCHDQKNASVLRCCSFSWPD